MNDQAIAARIQEIAESLDPADIAAGYRQGLALEAQDRAEREAWIAPEQADWDSDLDGGEGGN